MTAYQHICHGFEPVFDERSRVLVLGSFPSVLSRKNSFYYGNPQNRFWRVAAAAFGEAVPADEDIDGKRELLLRHGVALWDVIDECDIKGSSDASIKNVVPTDVRRILEAASIGAVICNGATAGRLYKHYLQWETGMEARVLPSTSPANASWSLERLVQRWGEELRGALGVAVEYEARRASERGGAASKAPRATSYSVHYSMQGNKSKNTKPELLVRQALQQAGLTGYRLQWKVPGRPDIAWPGKKVCLFVNGCFWHRCPLCTPSAPAKNTAYWTAKFARNVERDQENLAALEAAGWRVHVVWECQLKKKTRDATFADLLPKLARELDKPLKE